VKKGLEGPCVGAFLPARTLPHQVSPTLGLKQLYRRPLTETRTGSPAASRGGGESPPHLRLPESACGCGEGGPGGHYIVDEHSSSWYPSHSLKPGHPAKSACRAGPALVPPRRGKSLHDWDPGGSADRECKFQRRIHAVAPEPEPGPGDRDQGGRAGRQQGSHGRPQDSGCGRLGAVLEAMDQQPGRPGMGERRTHQQPAVEAALSSTGKAGSAQTAQAPWRRRSNRTGCADHVAKPTAWV
jgi:hypothetical protein